MPFRMIIPWPGRGTDQTGKTLLYDAVDSNRKEGTKERKT